MVIRIPARLISSNFRIASLYKQWLRTLEGNTHNRLEFRYKAVLARVEFEAILNEPDSRKAKEMLLQKEEELHTIFPLPPIYFVDSPNGVAYERYTYFEDWCLDCWHPLEKAVFPHFFTRRELRKQQYIEMWEKQYGPPPPEDDH